MDIDNDSTTILDVHSHPRKTPTQNTHLDGKEKVVPGAAAESTLPSEAVSSSDFVALPLAIATPDYILPALLLLVAVLVVPCTVRSCSR